MITEERKTELLEAIVKYIDEAIAYGIDLHEDQSSNDYRDGASAYYKKKAHDRLKAAIDGLMVPKF